MKTWKRFTILFTLAAVSAFFSGHLLGQTASEILKPSAQSKTVEPDGQHDFDFEVGTWNIHLKRLLHPLTGDKTWVEFDGTSVTRKVWNGRANFEEFETDSPATHTHIEGLTLPSTIRSPTNGVSIGRIVRMASWSSR